jgi:hypothetical protein
MNESQGKLAIDDFLKLEKAERVKAIDDGRFSIPSLKADPEGRKKFDDLFLKPPSQESAPISEAEIKKEEEKIIEQPPKIEEPVAEKPKGRFQSIEDAEREVKDKESLIDTQREALDKLRESSSKDRELADKLKRDLEEIGKKSVEKQPEVEEVEIPETPEPPDVFDKVKYPEGAYDDNFIVEQNKYFKALSDYNKKIIKAVSQVKELRKQIKDFEPKIKEAHEFREASVAAKAKEESEKSKSETDSTIDQIQKDLGFSTKTPWKKINENALLAGNKDAAPEVRAAAQAFIKSLPKEELDNFNKLASAAGHALDGGKPKFKPGSNLYRANLEDQGFVFVKVEKKSEVDLTKVKPETPSGVVGIPGDRMGADDDIKDKTKAEKKERYLELLMINEDCVKKRIRLKNQSPLLYEEKMKLEQELGYSE